MSVHTDHPYRLAAWSAAAALVAAPLIAMQFTDEVQWQLGDFVIFGALISGAGLALEWMTRLSDRRTYQIGAAILIGTSFILVWANLAVGLVGASASRVNLVFFLEPLGLLVGALLIRADPRWMGWLAVGAAAVHALLYVLASGVHDAAPAQAIEQVGAIGVFAGGYLLAAVLFFRSASLDSKTSVPD